MKTEPEVFSFDDLMSRPDRTEPWDGIRNYQARNFMRDEMQIGDLVVIYHSNTTPPHAAGVARVASEARPDPTALDPSEPYFDPKSDPDNPRWMLVDIQGVRAFETPVPLADLKANPALVDMRLVARGNRLSIMPCERAEFEEVLRMGGLDPGEFGESG